MEQTHSELLDEELQVTAAYLQILSKVYFTLYFIF